MQKVTTRWCTLSKKVSVYSSNLAIARHCGLRGYELFQAKWSVLADKSQDLSTKWVIFSKLPKKFSTSLIKCLRPFTLQILLRIFNFRSYPKNMKKRTMSNFIPVMSMKELLPQIPVILVPITKI